ncbi:MAG: signal peptidase I [Lachnospiraceae bacterium]|jgi:signal peptidase I|nr:signal peptidase I [Lachnospiraceae bacterium]
MNNKKGLTFIEKKKRLSKEMVKDLLNMTFAVAAAIFLAIALVYSFGIRTSIIGPSMEPILYNGQEVLVNRLSYQLFSPQKGDVVVFLPNGNRNSHYYLKRVVGMPGDTVQIIDGYLHINGERVEEGDSFDKMADPGIAANPITLKNNEYFVLGDNRNDSEDSRSGNIGVVKEETIIGKAWFKLAIDGENMGLVE